MREKTCGHWPAPSHWGSRVPPSLAGASPRKGPWDGSPSTSQVTVIIIRQSSQHFPCTNSDNPQAHLTDGEIEAEEG